MSDNAAEIEAIKSKMVQKSYYLMSRKVIDSGRISAVMLDHYKWLIMLEKKGKVFASGPLFHRDGQKSAGMSVLCASSWEEAEALAADDPFVTSGAMEFALQRWQVNEGRIRIAVNFSDGTFSID